MENPSNSAYQRNKAFLEAGMLNDVLARLSRRKEKNPVTKELNDAMSEFTTKNKERIDSVYQKIKKGQPPVLELTSKEIKDFKDKNFWWKKS